MAKKKLDEDDFLGMSDGAGSDTAVFDENTTEIEGIPVIAVIPEFKGEVVQYPLPVDKSIFPNGATLNVVRRTPEQDVTFSASANYVSKDKRAENE